MTIAFFHVSLGYTQRISQGGRGGGLEQHTRRNLGDAKIGIDVVVRESREELT